MLLLLLAGILAGSLLIISGNATVRYTSADKFCAACHVHPQADQTWKRSTHVSNQRGITVHCVDCHLPPEGQGYLWEKIKTGTRDVYGKFFKNTSAINWDTRSGLEYAVHYTYKTSCVRCHQNLFASGLSREGEDAHLYYNEKPDELHCINCHLSVGHYSETAVHARNVSFGVTEPAGRKVFTEPALIKRFNNFTEYIPGSTVSFKMVAVPGGTFSMGSPDDELYRKADEGPVRKVTISPFFMGRIEVSWDEYLAFYKETATQGKTTDAYLDAGTANLDAISGPTPPWGAPDQGWGKGSRPAITMTYHAAEVYCRWLSEKTGKKYRLPTEAEWEYAARGGTTGPYFFEGNQRKINEDRFINKLIGTDTSSISPYVIYQANSMGTTRTPADAKENPFGLVNMLGNVSEFCQDWYSANTYAVYPDSGVTDPAGPAEGTEHVIRGGCYNSLSPEVRCAARDHTRTAAWLKTDPQIPKSIWWYSDCIHTGFRVVCEYKE